MATLNNKTDETISPMDRIAAKTFPIECPSRLIAMLKIKILPNKNRNTPIIINILISLFLN
jgi:hypothetical protein